MNPEPIDPALRRWLKICGGTLIVLAAVVLFGRFTNQIALVRVFPGSTPMPFPSALALLLAGIAFHAHGAGRQRIGRMAALGVLILGVVTLALYAVVAPLGVERLPNDAASPEPARGTGFDGTMSLNGAVSFALLGAAILLLGAARLRTLYLAITLSALFAISLLALVSDMTGLGFAVTWWRHAAMALHTAIALLIGGAGLVAWWLRQMSVAPKAVSRALPIFVVAGTGVFVLGAVMLVSNEQRQEGARLEYHTLEVEAAIDRFIASVARLESSTRAFAVTGDGHYLDRIQVHRQSTTTAANALMTLTTDNAAQHARALSLRPLVEQKFAINDAQVRARQQGGVEAAAQVLRAEAPEVMAGLRAATEGLQSAQRQLLLQRRAVTAINERRLRWVLFAGAITTIGIVTAAFSLVSRAQRDLLRAYDDLEARVRARTAQLHESERRLRFLADTMPQLVWTARLDGTIETLNRGWLSYLGIASEAEGIAAATAAVHPDDRPASLVEWEGMIREQRHAGGELRLRRADGEYRWHLWRAHPERDAAGHVVRWIGT
ncbi:MAG TPA: CHASE3 domain-containing protein, partial [Opitutaceae bacterium]|nr:CHASE3 domain-containing protein [Opitutaceae bacterium]